MPSLACQPADASGQTVPRGRVLRMLDAWAEWQMRHSVRVISRTDQRLSATMTRVTQPSTEIDRSKTSPCDR
jgi:hypothetical protein